MTNNKLTIIPSSHTTLPSQSSINKLQTIPQIRLPLSINNDLSNVKSEDSNIRLLVGTVSSIEESTPLFAGHVVMFPIDLHSCLPTHPTSWALFSQSTPVDSFPKNSINLPLPFATIESPPDMPTMF